MKTLNWIKSNPGRSGLYIVATKTEMGTRRRLEAHYDAKTKRWSFKNQTFVAYLEGSLID